MAAAISRCTSISPGSTSSSGTRWKHTCVVRGRFCLADRARETPAKAEDAAVSAGACNRPSAGKSPSTHSCCATCMRREGVRLQGNGAQRTHVGHPARVLLFSWSARLFFIPGWHCCTSPRGLMMEILSCLRTPPAIRCGGRTSKSARTAGRTQRGRAEEEGQRRGRTHIVLA